MNFNDIKKPKTVGDFRENLLKCYFSIEGKIFVKELGYIDVNKINCIKDLIFLSESKGYNTLSLTPKVIELVNWESYIKPKVYNYLRGEDILKKYWESNDTHLIICDNQTFVQRKIKENGSVIWKDVLELRELYQHYHNSVMGNFGIHTDFEQTNPLNYVLNKSFNFQSKNNISNILNRKIIKA